jgi:hypothetical protein
VSKFYGQVVGDRSAATRTGHRRIKAAAQSYNGSVITQLTYKEDGTLMVSIETAEGSSACGNTVFYGTLEEFKSKLGS